MIRRAASYRELSRAALVGVLDMLAGRYPSDEFAELRPRADLGPPDRRADRAREARACAVVSGGTIPDRGLYGVFLAATRPAAGRRARRGDGRREPQGRDVHPRRDDLADRGHHARSRDRVAGARRARQDAVLARRRSGPAGRARPRRSARSVRELARDARTRPVRTRWLRDGLGLDECAAGNLSATSPSSARDGRRADRSRDHDRAVPRRARRRPRVHPVAVRRARPRAVGAGCARRRLERSASGPSAVDRRRHRAARADGDDAPPDDAAVPRSRRGRGARRRARATRRSSRATSARTPRARCCCRAAGPGAHAAVGAAPARAAADGRRAPVPGVPDHARDLSRVLARRVRPAGARRGAASVRRREIRVRGRHRVPSPFARSLVFDYVARSSTRATRRSPSAGAGAHARPRAAARADRRRELRDLLDEVPRRRRGRAAAPRCARPVRDADELHDLVRRLGDLTSQEIAARVADGDAAATWLDALARAHRVLAVRVRGEERSIAVEDAARYRDGLGVALPVGVPHAFLEPVADPVGDLVARYARTHGPFLAADPAERFGLAVAVVEQALRALEIDGRVVDGEFRPGGSGREWIGVEVLRTVATTLARRAPSRDRARSPRTARAFRPRVAGHRRGNRRRPTLDALLRVVEQLQGVPLPASALESQILPARLPGYVRGAPRPARRRGRAGVGRRRCARAQRRMDHPCARREGHAAASGYRAARRVARGATAARRPRRRWRALLPPARRGRTRRRRHRAAAGVVGSGVDGARDQRHAGAVARDAVPAPVEAARRTPRVVRRVPRDSDRPPARAGRSLVPARVPDATRRVHAAAEQLLMRHGVVTRGAVVAERVPGGFAGVYPVLKAFEETRPVPARLLRRGTRRRAVRASGRRRSPARGSDRDGAVHVLAATGPGKPVRRGAALARARRHRRRAPARAQGRRGGGAGRRPPRSLRRTRRPDAAFLQ